MPVVKDINFGDKSADVLGSVFIDVITAYLSAGGKLENVVKGLAIAHATMSRSLERAFEESRWILSE